MRRTAAPAHHASRGTRRPPAHRYGRRAAAGVACRRTARAYAGPVGVVRGRGRSDEHRPAGAGTRRRHRTRERAKSIGVRAGNWLSLRHAQALPNAADIATTKRPRDRAIIAVLLGCALRLSQVAALADGRASDGFKPEATVAAGHASTPELSVQCLRFPGALLRASCGFSARRGVAGGAGRPTSAGRPYRGYCSQGEMYGWHAPECAAAPSPRPPAVEPPSSQRKPHGY